MLSADGRFVAFGSFANDLVANDTNGTADLFVRDLKTGTTTLVSVNSVGNPSNYTSFFPAFSANSRFLAFFSNDDLVANDTNGKPDVFVHDLKTGTTTLASVNSAGTTSSNGTSFSPILSANGRYLAFNSDSSNLVANDTNDKYDVFVRDLKTGTTTLASVNSAGTATGNDSSYDPVLSANGRFVAFTSAANDLVAGDTNFDRDVFVRDLKTGTTTLASVISTGAALGVFNAVPALSADGRFVAFENLVPPTNPPGPDDGIIDSFVRDLKTGTTRLASVNSAGTASGNDSSTGPVLSADGRFVAFGSNASDLAANDTNGLFDVFVRPVER